MSERLAELVGLDKAQFEQVVLIPQGRFEEVLKARTQERADLLAKLFPVDVYIRTTEALRQLAADRRDAYEELAGGRRTAEDRIRADVAAFFAEVRRHPHGRWLLGAAGARRTWSDAGADVAYVEVDLGSPARAPRPDGGRARRRGRRPGRGGRSVTRGLATPGPRSRRPSSAGSSGGRTWPRCAATRPRWRPTPRSPSALERAATVATLSTSVEAWRAATERLVGLDAERERLRAAVDASWVDGADRSALDSATTAHLLSAAVATEAAALEAADRRFVELGRRHGAPRNGTSGAWPTGPPPWPGPSTERDGLADRVAAAEAAAAEGAAPGGGAVRRPWPGSNSSSDDAAAVRDRAAVVRQVGGPRRRPGTRPRRQLAGAEERVAGAAHRPGGRDWPAGWPPTSRTVPRARPVARPSTRPPAVAAA